MPTTRSCALSLTYDIEMCTNFPVWEDVWDHLKAAIDQTTKDYVAGLADIAAERGVKLQFFVLGGSFEDPDLDYLKRLVADGHALGNHTYRHVNVLAKTFPELQITYRNDPTLADGYDDPLAAKAGEIAETTRQMVEHLGVRPRGFRTPGGFQTGLAPVPEVQQVLLDQGFDYCSGQYRLPLRENPTHADREDGVRWSVEHLQPYRYPTGLLEVPMTGISDIWAFRNQKISLDEFIALTSHGLRVAAEAGGCYSALMHPQVMAARDPDRQAIRALLDLAGSLDAEVVTNDQIADRVAGG